MISEDEYLERIVAGIHNVTTEGADVRWNEVLNGRQFDVVVRFALGTLRYLVLIEVKNRTRKASAQDLDAFVTKARDQLVSKAVFVTAAGFQEGAKQTARRHGVELFTVTFDESEIELSTNTGYIAMRRTDVPFDSPPTLTIGDPEPGLCIAAVELIYANRKRYAVPDEQSQMTYYLTKTQFEDGDSLESFLQSHRFSAIDVGAQRRERIKLKRPRVIRPPDDYYYPNGKLAALDCEITGVMSRSVSGTLRIEPTAFRHPVLYTNVQTRETHRFALDQLPLGGRELMIGAFYCGLHPLRYYHCAAVDGDLVTWHLIESFQSGNLMRGTFTQKVQYAGYYIPVVDKRIVQRLERRLTDYLELLGHNEAPPAPAPALPASRQKRWLPWGKKGAGM